MSARRRSAFDISRTMASTRRARMGVATGSLIIPADPWGGAPRIVRRRRQKSARRWRAASDQLDVGRLGSARALRDRQPHALLRLQIVDAGTGQHLGMDEHVLPAAVRRDEAVALAHVIELDRALDFLGRARRLVIAPALEAAGPGPGPGPGRRGRSPRGGMTVAVEVSTSRICETCGPFCPCTISHVTVAPWGSESKPARSTADTWQKTSGEPSSGTRKPNPLVGLNHLTWAVIDSPSVGGELMSDMMDQLVCCEMGASAGSPASLGATS